MKFTAKNIRIIFNLVLSIFLYMMIITLLFPVRAESPNFSSKQNIRVLLKRLNITTRSDIHVDGTYALSSSNGTIVLKKNSDLTIIATDLSLYVYSESAYWKAGSELCLIRHHSDYQSYNGLRFMDRQNLYMGDLYLYLVDGKIQMILHIDIEDYLKGVVPYEMSDSFPLEALKSQAIASRTYALSKLDNKANYDLEDTTNDQVFMGFNPKNINSIAAIKETSGIFGLYDDEFAICYYTASNGGQTELPANIWGGVNPPYLIMQSDPYDYENPESPVRKLIIPKFPDKHSQAPQSLQKLLATYLENSLEDMDFSTNWQHLRLDQILNIELEEPKFPQPSELFTRLKITFTYSSKNIIGRNDRFDSNSIISDTILPSPTPHYTAKPSSPTPFFAGPPIVDENIQLDEHDGKYVPTTPIPYNFSLSEDKDPFIYSDYISVAEPTTLSIPIFPDNDKLLGLSINVKDNELIRLEETEDSFILYSRRFGHGVGMSQRGAQYMAENHNMLYQDILSFYYPNMQFSRLPDHTEILPTLEVFLQSTPGPTPNPTPRPTLMPITVPLEKDWLLGKVYNIEEDSSLNLREEPDLSSQIIRRLYKDQLLIILPTPTAQGWYHVKTDVIEGFVMQDFVELTPLE